MQDENTIAEAKTFLRENFKDGVDCPCCGQLVKLYEYPLNNSIALTMMKMYRIHMIEGKSWIHVQKEINPSSGGYFSLAKWWGLMVGQAKDENDDKKYSGYWGLTKKGIAFVRGEIDVPKAVKIFNSNLIGFSEERINIKESLSKKFSYSELMKGTDVS